MKMHHFVSQEQSLFINLYIDINRNQGHTFKDTKGKYTITNIYNHNFTILTETLIKTPGKMLSKTI